MKNPLTIVGPEPSGPERRPRSKRLLVETVLLMAKYDAQFRELLLSDRDRALAETALDFSPAEKMLLRGVSREQLLQSIEEFRVPGVHQTSLTSWAKAAAVLLLLTSLTLANVECGEKPNKPMPAGSAPDDTTQVEGITPDDSVSALGSVPDDSTWVGGSAPDDPPLSRGSTPDP